MIVPTQKKSKVKLLLFNIFQRINPDKMANTKENGDTLNEVAGASCMVNKGAIKKKIDPNQRVTRGTVMRHEEIDKRRQLSEASSVPLFNEEVRENNEAKGLKHMQTPNLKDILRDESSDVSDDQEETVMKNTRFKTINRRQRECRKSLDAALKQAQNYDRYLHNHESMPVEAMATPNQRKYNLEYNVPNNHEPNFAHNRNVDYQTNTVVYRMPIDTKNMPTFNGTSSLNPKEYIKRLETWLEDQQIQPNEYTNWAKRSLRGQAKLWDEIFCENTRTYHNWKQEFLQKYWSRDRQQQALMDIYNGRYIQSEYTEMSTYFLKILKQIKEIDLISINEGIAVVINHFPVNVARILISLNPRTPENIYEVLEQFDELENKNRQNRNSLQQRHFKSVQNNDYKTFTSRFATNDFYRSNRDNHFNNSKHYEDDNKHYRNSSNNRNSRNYFQNDTRRQENQQRGFNYQTREDNNTNRRSPENNYLNKGNHRDSPKQKQEYKPRKDYNVNVVQTKCQDREYRSKDREVSRKRDERIKDVYHNREDYQESDESEN